MTFRYHHLFRRLGYPEPIIDNFMKNTGYGKMYSNYKKAQQYLTSWKYSNVLFDVVQCDFCSKDASINNCFVIFQSDYLPTSFLNLINKQNGYILVPSQWMKNVILDQSGCNPERIIKIPYLQDFEKLEDIKSLDIEKNNEIITFYAIAENKDIKNLLSLYNAFKYAFKNHQDVQLIIKTSNANFLEQYASMKVNRFPKITVINRILQQEELNKLHMLGDVYVSTAFGVGWEIPPFQASFLGNILICGNHSAFTEWVDFDVAVQLQSYKKSTVLSQYSNGRFQNKYEGNKWRINMIQTDEIVKKLRYVYDNFAMLKHDRMDLTKFDIKNINYFIQNN